MRTYLATATRACLWVKTESTRGALAMCKRLTALVWADLVEARCG